MTKGLAPTQNWHSKAPANTMILGEHSVVYGQAALACALDQFIEINWQTRSDDQIHIHSALAQHETNLSELTPHPKLEFVMLALQAFQAELPFGLNIEIKSEFSSTIGLGSSAAVLAAMLSGLNHICQQHHSTLELFEIGHAIILKIQGRGSATDLAASLSGGVIYFQPKSEIHLRPIIKKLNLSLPICLIYAGYKTPTAQVLKQVAEQWADQSEALDHIYQQMGTCTQNAFKALQNLPETADSLIRTSDNLNPFYTAFDQYQDLMDQLGVNDKTLTLLINTLKKCPHIQAAKISGSGLGDCVLGLGSLNNCSGAESDILNQYQKLEVNITPLGASTTCA